MSADDLADFTDDEIKSEYVERFGAPDEPDLDDFSSSDLIEELEERDAMPEAELDGVNEIADLIAEAARISRHAAKAYSLLREVSPRIGSLEARQQLVAGRMKDAA